MLISLFTFFCGGGIYYIVCAAPGSKTFQLLELMNNSTEIGEVPYGMV